jgi:FkbM family methyltransferase
MRSTRSRWMGARVVWALGALARYPRFAWRLIAQPARVRLHGVVLDVSEASPAHRRAVYAERYERGEARLLSLRLAPDDVVLEIGAGIGFLSALCARRVGSERVTAVEANPALLPRVRATWALNGVNPELVFGVPARESGEAELRVADEFVASAVLAPRAASGEGSAARAEGSAVRVPQLAVGELMARVQPSCLVIDIEGGEAELLPAIDWRGVRKLVLEVHPQRIGSARVRELIELLAAQGLHEERGISSTRKKYFARERA